MTWVAFPHSSIAHRAQQTGWERCAPTGVHAHYDHGGLIASLGTNHVLPRHPRWLAPRPGCPPPPSQRLVQSATATQLLVGEPQPWHRYHVTPMSCRIFPNVFGGFFLRNDLLVQLRSRFIPHPFGLNMVVSTQRVPVSWHIIFCPSVGRVDHQFIPSGGHVNCLLSVPKKNHFPGKKTRTFELFGTKSTSIDLILPPGIICFENDI